MKLPRLALLLLALIPIANLRAQDRELYLAMGQSNMVGLGAKAEPRHLAVHPRIELYLSPGWKQPLAWRPTLGTSPAQLGRGGVGPWWAFSQVMAETEPAKRLAIVMIAQSGTALNKWVKGGDFYEGNLAAAREALAKGYTLKGMIWHQGEAGTGIPGGGKYDEMFAQMIADYRADLGQGDFPVVAGTINSGKGGPVNDALFKLVGKLPNFAVAATGDRTLSDNVHYDAPTCETLGVEMAKQMLALRKGPAPVTLTKPTPPAFAPPARAKELLVEADNSTMTANAGVALGRAPLLCVQGGQKVRTAYLRFSTIPSAAKKLTLILHARAVPQSSVRLAVRPLLTTDFDETKLSATNAPAFAGEPVCETKVSIPSGLVTLDLTPLLATAHKTGPFAFALVALDDKQADPLILDSREGSFAPRLLVE